jgi:hypothetical protein
MNGDINQYGSPGQGMYYAPRESRNLAKKRRDVFEEGAVADFQSDVVAGLGMRNMQRASMLNGMRLGLNPQDDPELNTALGGFQISTMRQLLDIQKGLFSRGEEL